MTGGGVVTDSKKTVKKSKTSSGPPGAQYRSQVRLILSCS